MARRYVAIGVIGQSNEMGSVRVENGGSGLPQSSTYGPPVNDPITPHAGTLGSWWPRLTSRLANERNIHCMVRNCAVGATSITNQGATTSENWCGDPAVFDRDAGTIDATGTNSTLLLGAVKTQLDAISDKWEKWVYISIGQRDGGLSETLANFRDGYICAANWALNQGYKVILGFTVNAPSLDTWMTTVGSPAVTAALEYFAGNSNVIAGADLHSLGIGVTYDGFHLYKPSNDDAADAIFDSLVVAGW